MSPPESDASATGAEASPPETDANAPAPTDLSVPPPTDSPPRRGRRNPPVPPALATAASWGWRVLVVGALVVLVARFLAGLTVLMLPLFLSILLAALLRRPALLLRRFLPRGVAGLLTLLAAIVVAGAIGYLVAERVSAQSGQLVAQANGLLNQLQTRVSRLPGVGSGSTNLVDQARSWVTSHGSDLLSGAFAVGTLAIDLVTATVLTLFLTLFFLIDGERIWAWLVRLLPRSAQQATNGAGLRAFHVLSGWIGGTAVIALIHAVAIGVTLWLLGTPLVLVLAVLVFIGSFIPIIGAFLFGGLAVLVTLVTHGLIPALVLLAVLLMENLLEGHVYQPLIMGRTLSLHPIAILLVIGFGQMVGGIFGAIVAVPVAAAVHASVKYLTGVEDIHGRPLRDEDRTAPIPPLRAMPPRSTSPARTAPSTVTDGGVSVAGAPPGLQNR